MSERAAARTENTANHYFRRASFAHGDRIISWERVLRAINHQTPDRAPIDLGVRRQTIFSRCSKRHAASKSGDQTAGRA
jgi:hypothetical protein